MSNEKSDHIIIDPPVGPYSTKLDIMKWLNELRAMDQNNIEVQACLKEAEDWLKVKDDSLRKHITKYIELFNEGPPTWGLTEEEALRQMRQAIESGEKMSGIDTAMFPPDAIL